MRQFMVKVSNHSNNDVKGYMCPEGCEVFCSGYCARVCEGSCVAGCAEYCDGTCKGDCSSFCGVLVLL